MQNQHILKVQKTATYATWGELSPNTQNIWVVTHGYGQLSEYFIKHFHILDPKESFVIAPEALSHFYLDGFSGRVGATWMTKYMRETAIEDYVNYIQAVFETATQGVGFSKIKLNLLGFSQGTATICRWAFQKNINFDKLILWAGSFPHDINFEKSAKTLQNKAFYFVYGKQDELVKQADFEKHLEHLENYHITPEIITFEGKHMLNQEIISKIAHL